MRGLENPYEPMKPNMKNVDSIASISTMASDKSDTLSEKSDNKELVIYIGEYDREFVTKRDEIVKRLGNGKDYRDMKVKQLTMKKEQDSELKSYDAWAHLDYDEKIR